MGCSASIESFNASQKPGVLPQSDSPVHLCSYASMKGSRNGSAGRSPAVRATTPRMESISDPRRQANTAVRETSGTLPMESSSSRLSLMQLRPPMISHSALNAVRPLSGEDSRSGVSSIVDGAQEKQKRLSLSSASKPPTQQSQREEGNEGEQHRLCEQSLVQLSSLIDLMRSPDTSRLQTRQEKEQQPEKRNVAAPSLLKLKSPTSMKEPPSQLSPRRANENSISTSAPKVNNNTVTTTAATTAPKPTGPSSPSTKGQVVDPIGTSGVEVVYLGDNSTFDLDSTDENKEEEYVGSTAAAVAAGEYFHITRDSTTLRRTAERVVTVKMEHIPNTTTMPHAMSSRPFVASHTTTTNNNANAGGTTNDESVNNGGGGLCLHQVVGSASLISLADTQDGIFTSISPRSTGNSRFGSVNPAMNDLNSVAGSRPSSSCVVGGLHSSRVDQANSHGLATFYNQPRECGNCRSPSVAFACELCEDFFLCEDCRFDVEIVRRIHDPTHAMLSIQDNHCSSSRTFSGDSIFSLSCGEGGMSSFFNPPCSLCGRAIDDTEPVYRCEQCDYVLCQECFFKSPEQAAADTTEPSQHEHVLKRFQRKPKSSSIHEGAVLNKTRNNGGNRVINDYVVVRLLGQGSYAKVKLVQHIRTQELFALKILKKQKRNSSSGINLGRSRMKLASAGVSEDNLLREIAVMKFVDHPNITKLKEVIEDVEAQKVYVIMEYCENGPVHVLGDPPLPLEKVLRYSADIVRGLLYLHSEFLYHRDIKPANCLVNHEFVVKIADFGTCNSQVRTKSSEGTLAFSCPEQIRGEEVSGEVVDSWAFALTLYEMAYGTLPFSTTSLLQLRNTVLGPEPIPIPDSGDAHVRELLASMLNKNLKERMLVSAAARHPLFAAFHIDPRGAPRNPMQSVVAATTARPTSAQRQQQRQQSQPTTAHGSPSSPPPPPPQEALKELFDKALESVHRGKNLKDCFHGVRALRRIRRKEAETARHGGESAVAAYGDVLTTSAKGVVSPSRRQTGCDYMNASPPGSAIDEADREEQHGMNCCSFIKEEEVVVTAALSAVEEIVQHHLSSKDPRVEVTYVSLARQSTLEKLNQLSLTVSELRLSHNTLASTAVLRWNSFSLLKEVSIAFNNLNAFPEDVLLAPRLVRLDLSHNCIPSIPSTLVSRASFLERLNLHHNCITHVGAVLYPASSAVATTTTMAVPLTPALSSPLSSANDSKAKKASPSLSPTAALEASTPHHSEPKMVSVLAAPCLRHVRLSGNPLESLPLALETTNRLKLVLDAIPALMEQWQAYTQTQPTTATTTKNGAISDGTAALVLSSSLMNGSISERKGSAPPPPLLKNKLPAVIVWDDSFPVRIPDVEPAVWLAVNNTAVYRMQTLRTCRIRRVVLCQCADPRFPNGMFVSSDLEAYFVELSKALQEQRQERQQQRRHQQQPNGEIDTFDVGNDTVGTALPAIVGRAARSYVESYFFVTDDESEEDGGYHDLVEYLNEALAAKEPVLVVVMTSGSMSVVRTNIVAALSTCLAQLRGKDPDDVSEQAELVVSTMRSLYA